MTFVPQYEKPHALTAVFVSNLDSVVAVSQSQNLRLLSADPEINRRVSPEDNKSSSQGTIKLTLLTS